MKKLLLLLIVGLLMPALSAVAENHLDFCGVPISGSLAPFESALAGIGMTRSDRDNLGAYYDNDMSTCDADMVYVAYDKGADVVYQVQLVYFADSRDELMKKTAELAEAYRTKYGARCTDGEFTDPTEPYYNLQIADADGNHLGHIIIMKTLMGGNHIEVVMQDQASSDKLH